MMWLWDTVRWDGLVMSYQVLVCYLAHMGHPSVVQGVGTFHLFVPDGTNNSIPLIVWDLGVVEDSTMLLCKIIPFLYLAILWLNSSIQKWSPLAANITPFFKEVACIWNPATKVSIQVPNNTDCITNLYQPVRVCLFSCDGENRIQRPMTTAYKNYTAMGDVWTFPN